ncbi:MAG: tRNA threonylcarbamoyladenosine dehydratase [Clostridia bacterium]|nr:tRNA threonylcarbamoyladenosine dehydratase [Clostridia bacterium]
MTDIFTRTESLIGSEALRTLAGKRVAVFGLGGVGGYTVEALARSGIGRFDLIDDDKIRPSNINRQILAAHSTVGRYKVDVAEERILDINPQAAVTKHRCFFMPENADNFDFSQYDYVVDAVDTVTAKIELVMRANAAGVPVISSMGAGNKLSATGFEVADIYKTSVCPLARVMRQELRKRGVKRLKVVYSREKPVVPVFSAKDDDEMPGAGIGNGAPDTVTERGSSVKKQTPGSIAFVPSVAGLIIAGEVVKDLTGNGKDE